MGIAFGNSVLRTTPCRFSAFVSFKETMDSSIPQENVYDELNNFEKKRSQDVPAVLEDYLSKVAKTGDPMFPWPKVKPLIVHKMEKVFTEFHEFCPTDDLPPCPNVENFDYVNMRKKLIEKIESFSSAPFTIQRLCELITAARKHYKRTDKFMRAVEKTILVVSTIEPYFQSRKGEDLVASPLLNGTVDASLTVDAQPPSSPSSQQEVESSQQTDETTETNVKDEPVPHATENGDSSSSSESDAISSSSSSIREECETSDIFQEPDVKAQDVKVQDEEPTSVASTCYPSADEEPPYATQQHPEEEALVTSEAVSSVTDEEKPESEVVAVDVHEELPVPEHTFESDTEEVREQGDGSLEEQQIPPETDLKCKEFLAIESDPVPESSSTIVASSPPPVLLEEIPTEYKQEVEQVEVVDGAVPVRISSEEVSESAVAMDTDPCPPIESVDESKSPDSSTVTCLDGEAMCAEAETGNVADQSEPMDQD